MRTRPAGVATIVDVAGRRRLPQAQDAARVEFSHEYGAVTETTNPEGVRLFVPGRDGFIETNWMVWPG